MNSWLPPRDSNPDMLIQNQEGYGCGEYRYIPFRGPERFRLAELGRKYQYLPVF